MGGRFFCPLTEKSDSGEASVNFSTDIDYEWQNRSRQRAEEAAGANRKQAVHYRTVGPGVWNPSYPCHAEAGRNDHPRPDTQQHGFSRLWQGRQRAFSNYSRQHQRRRTDTQGRKRPLHHWGRDCVPSLLYGGPISINLHSLGKVMTIFRKERCAQIGSYLVRGAQTYGARGHVSLLASAQPICVRK